ncbi:Fe(2+)-trafficking protein [Candidatus Vidania fulgoroideae]|nr:Fe(2+)-trafficking protein [Candidatus Vidania fulgoroideae]
MIKIKISKFIRKNFKKLNKWIKIQTIIINEKRLNLNLKKDFLFLKQKFIYFCIKKFYNR